MAVKGRFVSVTAISEMSHQCGIVTGVPPNPNPAGPLLWIAGGSCEVLAFQTADSGNAEPTVNIQGTISMLEGPEGNNESETFAIAVAADHTSFVFGGYVDGVAWINNIAVFAPGTTGDVAPIQFISGNLTGFWRDAGRPTIAAAGICIDDNKTMYVGFNNVVLTFAAGATGNVAPTTLFSLGETQCITSLCFDAARQYIWISSADSAASPTFSGGMITAIDTNGISHVSIAGSLTAIGAGLPFQVTIAADRSIYVAWETRPFPFLGSIAVFAADANGNIAPMRQFTTPAGNTGPIVGIAIDGAGNAHLSIGSASIDSGAIETVPASSSGTVSPLSVLTSPALTIMNDGASTAPSQLQVI